MDEIENSMWVHKLWEPIDQLNQSIITAKEMELKWLPIAELVMEKIYFTH
jgi:hypothetical protein